MLHCLQHVSCIMSPFFMEKFSKTSLTCCFSTGVTSLMLMCMTLVHFIHTSSGTEYHVQNGVQVQQQQISLTFHHSSNHVANNLSLTISVKNTATLWSCKLTAAIQQSVFAVSTFRRLVLPFMFYMKLINSSTLPLVNRILKANFSISYFPIPELQFYYRRISPGERLPLPPWRASVWRNIRYNEDGTARCNRQQNLILNKHFILKSMHLKIYIGKHIGTQASRR